MGRGPLRAFGTTALLWLGLLGAAGRAGPAAAQDLRCAASGDPECRIFAASNAARTIGRFQAHVMACREVDAYNGLSEAAIAAARRLYLLGGLPAAAADSDIFEARTVEQSLIRDRADPALCGGLGRTAGEVRARLSLR